MSPTTDRKIVLSKIQKIVGDKSECGKVEEIMGQYNLAGGVVFCYEDGDLLLSAGIKQREYKHENHINTRAYIFPVTTKWDFTSNGELRHYTVGAILWRQNNTKKEYCLFRRQIYPINQYTIPAGHLEMNETPEQAVRREIYEETQLRVMTIQHLWEEEIEDECRRGANYHYWYLYLCQTVGEPKINEEGDIINWFTKDEILGKLNLTKATNYLLNKFFSENKSK